ncbi:MAG: potassium channel protein [Acidobacteriota bacterium]|nr:potassium channel protein [Acidobacteriota bacterium]
MGDPFRRVRIALGALGLVLIIGTAGYLALGFSLLDAIFQTVSTITTVGFSSPHPLGAGDKAFTMILILGGVGTTLYAFSAVLELLVDGHMRSRVRRRRVEREIQHMNGHVIVCGWGRVGSEVARFLVNAGRDVVVVDRDPDRLGDVPYATVLGDVTDDDVLRRAGIDRAATLVAALDTDADNLYLTVAGKSLRSDLQIIARARSQSSELKLTRAGADRVVNPQQLGGDRMASFVTQPHVVDFVDVVMHDGSLLFRLGETRLASESALAGKSLRSAHVRDETGALVLAIRRPDGSFVTNPTPEEALLAGDVLISVGTDDQLRALERFAAQR